MRRFFIRQLSLALALVMLLSLAGVAEDLSFNGLEFQDIDTGDLALDDVAVDDGDGLDIPDTGDEIPLPGDDDGIEGPDEESFLELPELGEDLEGLVDAPLADVGEGQEQDGVALDDDTADAQGEGSQQEHHDIPGAQADNDALAEAYLRSVLPGFTKNSRNASPSAGRKGLAKKGLAVTLAMYDALKPMIEAVAEGKRTSAEFTFDSAALGTADHWWTPEELGLSSLDDEYLGDYLMSKESVDTGELVSALLEDCPYHLYWFDKTRGWATSCSYSTDGSRARLESVTLSMTVAEAYAAGTYTLNALPAAVSKAVAKIKSIISDNAGKNDLDKVTAYADVVCGLVEYNFPAADDDGTPYGNPWQIVWIFDGDSDTKVVCEGYAKAFKYLCDLSTFQGNVGCVLAQGMMYGGTGEGPHMWNSLKMPDGRVYLVDLTNCDAGDTCDYSLFLKGCTGEAGGPYVCRGLRYEFYDWIVEQFGSDSPWLAYSNADYGKAEVGGGDGAVNADWTALQAQLNVAADKSTVTLTKDITASDGNVGLEIPSGKTLTLDLAGHTLSRGLKAEKNDGYVLGVLGSLTLKDSVGGGKITGGWTSQYGGGIYVYVGGSLTVAGGEISGNHAFYGGGIGAPGANVKIQGGKIADNKAQSGGGGIKLEKGKLEMTGGEISGNQSCYGGGIYLLDGTFVLKGGKITNNDAYAPDLDNHFESGGGVYAYEANVTMTGGEISGNRANLTGGDGSIYHFDGSTVWQTSGGGMDLHYGTFNMAGGTIKNNTSTYGGGLKVEDSEFVMTGGKIINNTGDAGGGVMLHACGDSDYAVFTLNGGEISGNKAEGHGAGVYIWGTIVDNAKLVMEKGSISNNTAYRSETANSGGGVFVSDGSFLLKAGYIQNNKSRDQGGGITINGGKFEMTGGEISGNEAQSGGGGGLSFYKAEAYISAGNIINNTGDSGGGIEGYDSSVRMTGGSISGNTVNEDGGGVLIQEETSFEMTGGRITGNKAGRSGGGVVAYTPFVTSTPSTISLAGSPVIADNSVGTAVSNCELSYRDSPSNKEIDVLIKISGTLSQTASIGVTDGSPDLHAGSFTFTSGLGANGNIGAFFSDDPGYSVEWSADGKEARLVEKETPTATKVDLSQCQFTVKDQSYTGKALKPAVTVKYGAQTLTQGTDYTVSYKNNTKPGKATVTVTGQGNYTGTVKVYFTIRVPLSKCKLTVKDQSYTGKKLKPAVTVKYGKKTLKKGTDYTVTYKNNKAIGVATVTVKGKGGYTGTKNLTFKILPRAVAVSKLTAGKQSIKVTWKKRAEATGYQLQYALKSSFSGAKTVKIKKAKTVSATIKQLKTGKKYYVRIRTYKTVGKKTYYSAWSKAKSVKVK